MLLPAEVSTVELPDVSAVVLWDTAVVATVVLPAGVLLAVVV